MHVPEIDNETLEKLAKAVMRIRSRDVYDWQNKRAYDREDVQQEIMEKMIYYMHSDKYEKHCERRELEGREPAKYTTCLMSYAIAAFHRVQRQNIVVPAKSLDEGYRDSNESLGDRFVSNQETQKTSPIEIVKLLRRGDHWLDTDDLWRWWEDALSIDSDKEISDDVLIKVVSLPEDQLAALVLTEVMGIDKETLYTLSGKPPPQISALVNAAERTLAVSDSGYTCVVPPQPGNCFRAFCNELQLGLFMTEDAPDWIDLLAERLPQASEDELVKTHSSSPQMRI